MTLRILSYKFGGLFPICNGTTNPFISKYFPDRYIADVCTDDGDYLTEYFTDMSALFDWLGKIAERPVRSQQEVDAFVEEWKKENVDAFVNIHEYQIKD